VGAVGEIFCKKFGKTGEQQNSLATGFAAGALGIFSCKTGFGLNSAVGKIGASSSFGEVAAALRRHDDFCFF